MKLSDDQKLIKKLKQDNSYLKEEVRRLEKRNAELREDQQKYQSWMSEKFGWFVELLSKSSTPDMKWLIQDTTKLLQRTEKFYWESRK